MLEKKPDCDVPCSGPVAEELRLPHQATVCKGCPHGRFSFVAMCGHQHFKELGRVDILKAKAKASSATPACKSTKSQLTTHILKDKSKRSANVKTRLSNNESKPDADEFRKNVTNMYLRNKLSAKDTAMLVSSAHANGCEQLDDLGNVGKSGDKKTQRNLMRKLIKTTK